MIILMRIELLGKVKGMTAIRRNGAKSLKEVITIVQKSEDKKDEQETFSPKENLWEKKKELTK